MKILLKIPALTLHWCFNAKACIWGHEVCNGWVHCSLQLGVSCIVCV